MASVTINVAHMFDANRVIEPDAATVGSGDVGSYVQGSAVLRVTNAGGTDETLHIVRNDGLADSTATIPAADTCYVPVTDTTIFAQSDGKVHVTTSAALSIIALAR